MYHEVSRGQFGKLTELKNNIEECERLQALLDDHLIQRTNLTEEKLAEWKESNKDIYLTAEEALELSLVDEVIIGPVVADRGTPSEII
jgi:ATP-dependent Clp protease protease subunit